MTVDPLLRAQPHAEAVHDARPQDVLPDRVEPGTGIVVEQNAQRLLEVPGGAQSVSPSLRCASARTPAIAKVPVSAISQNFRWC